MKKVALLVVALFCCSIQLLAGGYSMNDTGETVYELRVEFSEPVVITGFGDVLTVIEPIGESSVFTFTGGALEAWGGHWFNWAPTSASLVSEEWLTEPVTSDERPSEGVRAAAEGLVDQTAGSESLPCEAMGELEPIILGGVTFNIGGNPNSVTEWESLAVVGDYRGVIKLIDPLTGQYCVIDADISDVVDGSVEGSDYYYVSESGAFRLLDLSRPGAHPEELQSLERFTSGRTVHGIVVEADVVYVLLVGESGGVPEYDVVEYSFSSGAILSERGVSHASPIGELIGLDLHESVLYVDDWMQGILYALRLNSAQGTYSLSDPVALSSYVPRAVWQRGSRGASFFSSGLAFTTAGGAIHFSQDVVLAGQSIVDTARALLPDSLTSALPPEPIEGLEYIGNPALESYPPGSGLEFARSVHDMAVWKGRLYIGGGSDNLNAGPVDVWAYDPATGEFASEFKIDDHSINRFQILSHGLYISGTDAMESWEFGNIYRNDGGGWEKLRTLPEALHIHDIDEADGYLVAAGAFRAGPVGPGGPQEVRSGGALYISSDGGRSWTVELFPCTLFNPVHLDEFDPSRPDVQRFVQLFKVNGELYANGYLMPRVYRFEDGRFHYVDVHPFPDASARAGWPCTDVPPTAGMLAELSKEDVERWEPCITAVMTRAVELRDEGVYIAQGVLAEYFPESQSYESEMITMGLYVASDMAHDSIRNVRIPPKGVMYVDLLVHEDTVYLLSTEMQDDRHIMRLEKTTDFEDWETVIEFSSQADAYSFEYLDGFFYFGLGGDNPSSGGVYRLEDRP